MSEYPVNRGIGKPVEFKGLKSQYLFIFAGGLLAVFVVFIVLFMAGVNQWLCIGVHLPDCRRHYPAFVLPLKRQLCLNIR